MNRKTVKYLICAAALSIASNASAIDVVVSAPGTLAQALSDSDLTTLTELNISGPIDASDLYFLGNNAKALSQLNLTNATIEAYNGEKVINGYQNYKAGVIPAGVFAGSRLSAISLPAGVSEIGGMAFAYTPLSVLPDLSNISKIDDAAFAATAIKTLTYPATAKLGTNVFAGSSVQSVTLPQGASVADGAFAGCSALTTVNGSNTVVAIGNHAFENTTALKSFAFGSNIKSIGSNAFRASGLTDADLSASTALDSIGEFAFAQMDALENITISAANVKFAPGVFFDDKALTNITLPNGTKAITDYLLKGTESLAVSALPESATTIGRYALAGNTATTTISLPASLQYIGDGAMEGMTGLTEINATQLDSRPEIGADVWAGVNQPNVSLKVDDSLVADFKSADQWQYFNISTTSGTEEITTPDAAEASIRARFVGTTLQIQATAVNIASVDLFDFNGIALISTTVNGSEANVETADFANPYFIVTVTLANGNRSSLKLKR